ncbi:hypothetical protein D9757_005335 [Collybiopsis confluens]|uniref:Large ribosomal subunit protein uL4m n=1 Tax=Collybiopsis confluens TaxID=2823264 RepID=A0A8H5HLH3_9AGAR|nr:hypothetical protein D9757_005335 [Collybiopsis confluens]
MSFVFPDRQYCRSALTQRQKFAFNLFMLKFTLRRIISRTAAKEGTQRFGPSAATPLTQAESLPSPSMHASPVSLPVYVALTAQFNSPSDMTQDTVAVLDPTVFHHPIRRDILHLCVNYYRDSLRQGSANTKTRGEVRGSGRKIRPQKGTGRARLGDAQSPMLRGGGVAFGPRPRDFSTKLPRKVVQMGMRVALSSKIAENSLGVMESMNWQSGKTRHLAQKLDSMRLKHTLFITGEDRVPTTLHRAIRNIPLVGLTTSQKVNVYEVLKWPRVMLDAKAVTFFERTLGNSATDAPIHIKTPSVA